MGKRKLVPAALHSELTEYSSLIRALRASNSLDVTTHLARTSFSSGSKPDSNDSDADDHVSQGEIREIQRETTDAEDEYETDTMTNIYPPTSSALPSRDVSPFHQSRSSSVESSRDRKRKRPSSLPQRRRDAWTRWPLLVDDIHLPEWNLEDEIGYLAEHVLKHQSQTSSHEAEKDDSNHGDLDSEDVDDVDPSFLPHLTEVASNYLSTILALLAAHTPNRPDSQQNRVEPMGWRAVLDVLSSSGDPNVADPKMLSSVKMRMESLYTHDSTEEPIDSRGSGTQNSTQPRREAETQRGTIVFIRQSSRISRNSRGLDSTTSDSALGKTKGAIVAKMGRDESDISTLLKKRGVQEYLGQN
ncbi:hypothetical protein C0992_011162 [Termitomyces sp. T32_za158]|nr:hypothetical protein C0992_011162 [Termitomyces sp. T32_za158]